MKPMNKWWFAALGAAAVVMIASVLMLMEPLERQRITGVLRNDADHGETLEPVQPPESPADVLVRVQAPQRNETIQNPLQIRGEARGIYFFEASFPIKLLDANGLEVATAIATAESDWMTQDFVPFSATLTFIRPPTETGSLVFMRDNPSGLPEHDASFVVPVRFGEALVAPEEGKASVANDGCVISGCSGEICGEEQMASTCLYRAEYSCYKTATCERNKGGKCEWLQSDELASCLKQVKMTAPSEKNTMVY